MRLFKGVPMSTGVQSSLQIESITTSPHMSVVTCLLSLTDSEILLCLWTRLGLATDSESRVTVSPFAVLGRGHGENGHIYLFSPIMRTNIRTCRMCFVDYLHSGSLHEYMAAGCSLLPPPARQRGGAI